MLPSMSNKLLAMLIWTANFLVRQKNDLDLETPLHAIFLALLKVIFVYLKCL